MHLRKQSSPNMRRTTAFQIPFSSLTIDQLSILSSGAYSDVNGNSKPDKGDIFGIAATTVANTELLVYLMGFRVIERNCDNSLKPVLSNELLFMPLWLKTCEYLRDMKDDCGILPYPKYDETQENYILLIQDTVSLYSVPSDVKNIETVCAAIEALCAENYCTVVKRIHPVSFFCYGRESALSRRPL